MSQTVLQLAQNIASAIDSDDFNSISDTVEAYQIARVVEETYYEICAALSIPSKQSLILLDALADLTHPNYLKIPDTAKEVFWIKYDYQALGIVGDYVDLVYLYPDEFISRTRNNAGSSNSPPYTQVIDFSGATLNIVTSLDPTYWTTFDNKYVLTDSYNSSKDTTLQNTKSVCWGQNNLSFVLTDSWTPELDDDLFPYLLAEAKSVCFNNIKQTAAPKEDQRARRQLIRIQNDLWRGNQRKPYDRVPDYGRRRANVNPLATSRNPIS